MDKRSALDFTVPRKNSTSTAGAAKKPKTSKSYSAPVNAAGRGGKRGGGANAASTSKTARGGAGSRGSTRGGNTTRGRGRGSAGVGGGRKMSLQRQQLSSSQKTQQESFDGTISSVTTPAPSTAPSTPRDAYFSVPQTPASELDQYIVHDNDLAEGGTPKVIDNNKGEGEEEEDADDELGGTANAEWSQTRSKEELK